VRIREGGAAPGAQKAGQCRDQRWWGGFSSRKRARSAALPPPSEGPSPHPRSMSSEDCCARGSSNTIASFGSGGAGSAPAYAPARTPPATGRTGARPRGTLVRPVGSRAAAPRHRAVRPLRYTQKKRTGSRRPPLDQPTAPWKGRGSQCARPLLELLRTNLIAMAHDGTWRPTERPEQPLVGEWSRRPRCRKCRKEEGRRTHGCCRPPGRACGADR
jgi:hypothetical protein